MLHGDKVLGKMMPEIIRKTHDMTLSSNESVEKNQMARMYWKILDSLQKKRGVQGRTGLFFASKY